MKKCISLVMALVMALALLPAVGSVTNAAGIYTPVYTNSSGVCASGATPHAVNWTLYYDGTLHLYPDLTITRYLEPSDGDCWDSMVFFPTAPGQMSQIPINEVVTALVAEGIANICTGIFTRHQNLHSVTLYDVPLIDTEAFHGCHSLWSVTVYGSLDAIGDYAFSDCNQLMTFTATGTVDRIGEKAFYKRYGTEATDGSLLSFHALRIGEVGDSAFYSCSSLYSVAPIHGSIGTYAFSGTAFGEGDASPVILVSNHSGTLGKQAFPWGTKLYYTGTEEEFQARYTNNSINPQYQMLSETVSWSLEGNVLSINGEGRTIDLLEEIEQPWMNVPGAGTPDDQRDAITRVRVANDIECGAHILDGLQNKLEPRYQVTVNGGTSDGQYFHTGRYFADEIVTIEANAPDPGKVFSAWSGAQGLTFTEGSANTAEAKFVMPAHAVTLTATYETGYTLTVRNGSGGGLYAAGASVTATANPAPEGKRFKEWIGITGSWIISGSKTSPTVTFRMPSYTDYIEATYEDIVINTVTVNGGTGGGSYEDGSSVTVTANAPAPGKRFKGWTGANGLAFTSGSASTATATFTMPRNAVTLTATYEDILYSVTVTDDGNGTAAASPASGAAGTPVTLTATPNEGFRFQAWQVLSGGVTVENDAFTIGTADVAIKAVFEEIPSQPDDPTEPTEPVTEPTEPATEPADSDGLCKWCGEDHSGSFWQRIVGFFHSILYFFAHLFGRK